MNVLMVGFPLKICGGLAVLALAMPGSWICPGCAGAIAGRPWCDHWGNAKLIAGGGPMAPHEAQDRATNAPKARGKPENASRWSEA